MKLFNIFNHRLIKIDIWYQNKLLISITTEFKDRLIPGDLIIFQNMLDSLAKKDKKKAKQIEELLLKLNISLTMGQPVDAVFVTFPGSAYHQLVQVNTK